MQCPGGVQPSACKSACRRQVECDSPPRGGSVTCLADMCDCSQVMYTPSRITDLTRGVLSGIVMDAYLPASGKLDGMLRRALAFYVRGLLARMGSGGMDPRRNLPNLPPVQSSNRPAQGGNRPPPPGGNQPSSPGGNRPGTSGGNPQSPGTQPGLPNPPAPVPAPGPTRPTFNSNDQSAIGGNLPDWLLPENFLPPSENMPDPPSPPSVIEFKQRELAMRLFRRGLLLLIKNELFAILDALPNNTLGMDLVLLRQSVDRLLQEDGPGDMEDDSRPSAGPMDRGRGRRGGTGYMRGTGSRRNSTQSTPSPPGRGSQRPPQGRYPPQNRPPRRGMPLNCTGKRIWQLSRFTCYSS